MFLTPEYLKKIYSTRQTSTRRRNSPAPRGNTRSGSLFNLMSWPSWLGGSSTSILKVPDNCKIEFDTAIETGKQMLLVALD